MATDDIGLTVDAGMLDLFRMEAEMHAATLENGLVELEQEPQSARLIEPLMRAAHSIKGAARIVGLDDLVGLAHKMEDYLSLAQKGSMSVGPEAVDVLLQGADVYKQVSKLQLADLGAWIKAHKPVIAGLEEKLNILLSGGTLEQVRKEPEPSVETAKTGEPPAVEQPALPAEAADAVSPSPAAPPPESPPTSEPASTPAPEAKEAAPPAADNAVLVTAQNINRLMGLAGECLVESRFLRAQIQNLYQLKSLMAALPRSMEELREVLMTVEGGEKSDELLVEAMKHSGKCRELLARQIESFEMYMLRWENLSSVLYNETVATRMRPFKDGVHGFPRMIRDMARKLGKKIRLKISGEFTKVDRDVLTKLEAPLTHILRNACDHGLESPEERVAAGKPEEGTIHLEAVHRAGMLSVIISDDGRGIEIEKIRSKVVDRGAASPEVARTLTDQELLEFLFLSGFSTATQVTETSGRGVGLDVVHNMVHEVQGTVSVTSQFGRGTTFHLQLPLTLSVLRTLLVEISGEPYAFPLVRVDRVLVVPQECIELIEDRQYFPYEGQNIGLVPASQPLELEPAGLDGRAHSVVVVSDRLNQYGVVVDRLLGEHELVVRPLDARLGKVPNISAAAVKEDGSPILIIDAEDLVRSIDNMLKGGRIAKLDRGSAEVAARKLKRVLVVDDSITVREVERRLLENRGYHVEVAVDGMDGWNAVRSGKYDLVVSDIDMPRMNGIEMVKNIKSDPVLKDIPIVIVSYKDREEDRITGMQAGASAYLTKSSFYDESFVKAVADLIGEP